MTSCCGQASTKPLTERHRIRVRYLGGRPVQVVGPATKLQYAFSGRDREKLIDPRDAYSLVSSGGFQLLGVVEAEEQNG